MSTEKYHTLKRKVTTIPFDGGALGEYRRLYRSLRALLPPMSLPWRKKLSKLESEPIDTPCRICLPTVAERLPFRDCPIHWSKNGFPLFVWEGLKFGGNHQMVTQISYPPTWPMKRLLCPFIVLVLQFCYLISLFAILINLIYLYVKILFFYSSYYVFTYLLSKLLFSFANWTVVLASISK